MFDLIISGTNAEQFARTLQHLTILVKPQSIRICHVHSSYCDEIMEKARKQNLDVNRVKANLSIRDFGLIAFDFDCTLVQIDCIDHLAEQMGCGEVVSAMTLSAMRGFTDFNSHMKNSVALLKGATTRHLNKTIQEAVLAPGAKDFISFVQKYGVCTYIISGGLSQVIKPISQKLNMTGFVSNELILENEQLTGELTGPAGGSILDALGKRTTLEILCMTQKIRLSEAISIGDGANDLKMLEASGLGIAYHAKPIVQQQAQNHVNYGGMEVIQDFFIESWEQATKIDSF